MELPESMSTTEIVDLKASPVITFTSGLKIEYSVANSLVARRTHPQGVDGSTVLIDLFIA